MEDLPPARAILPAEEGVVEGFGDTEEKSVCAYVLVVKVDRHDFRVVPGSLSPRSQGENGHAGVGQPGEAAVVEERRVYGLVSDVDKPPPFPEAAHFVEQYTVWDDQLHGVIADRLQANTQYRYRFVRYYELDAAE